MNDKLAAIFTFLNENRRYNQTLQEKFYLSSILPFDNSKDKITSIIYTVAGTQSQPNIDKLAIFYKRIFNDSDCLNSMEEFIEKINPNKSVSFESLYEGMKNQDGWGKKTAALFCKNIFHLHNGKYSEKLKIWNDAPTCIDEDDAFFLPVDAVIIAIFKKLDSSKNWNFDKVNSTLKALYNTSEIEIWDDLWFWGFITQHGSGEEREFKWNENKYWNLKESDKNVDRINEIRERAEIFLRIISEVNTN